MSDDESDWEKEITEEGTVFYVTPRGMTPSFKYEASSLEPTDIKTPNKLSRIVRRKESKRNRQGSLKVRQKPSSSPPSSDSSSLHSFGQIKTFESFLGSPDRNEETVFGLLKNEESFIHESYSYGVFYISSIEEPTLLFLHPSKEQNNLSELRGIFSALWNSSPSITGGSTLERISFMIDSGVVMHGSFHGSSDNSKLLVIIAPGSVITSSKLLELSKEIVSTLLFINGSLEKAFERPKNVHKIFNFFFYSLFNLPSTPIKSCSNWFNLPDEITLQIHDALSQFEAGDFREFSEGFYGWSKEYLILGSILFYRGFLLSTHLSPEDSTSIFSYSKIHLLLEASKIGSDEIVVWNKIKRKNGSAILCIVGLGRFLMGVILEPEGGKTWSPDPFYVDQAMNTLQHLDDMGIPLVCDKWMELPQNPELLSTDDVFSPKRSSMIERRKKVVLKRTVKYEDGGSELSSEACEEENDESEHSEEEEELVTHTVSQLSLSPVNTIFHYISFDFGEGICLSPLSVPGGNLHAELLKNFKASVEVIHSSFQMAIANGEILRRGISPWFNRQLVPAKEKGILFQWTPAKEKESLVYWVVGRLFLHPKVNEVYVCYHDEAPQSTVELAFRLNHGIHI